MHPELLVRKRIWLMTLSSSAVASLSVCRLE